MGPRSSSFFQGVLGVALLAVCGCTKVLGDFKLASSKPPVDAGVDAGPGDIAVTPEEGLQTTEWGGRSSFTIVLKKPPRFPVGIALSVTPDTEGKVSPESVTFGTTNWNAPQTVFVRGLDNDTEGNTIYTVVTTEATSDDPHYDGVNPPDVTVLNIDDDTPGFYITPTTGLRTTESGGATAFTIALTAPPKDVVTVELSSPRSKEGRVSPSSLAFYPSNFRSPQTVTVTGVDDTDTDGPQMYSVVTGPAKSRDAAYDGLNPPDIQVVNVDDETPGVTITPMGELATSESGRTATFAVVLDAPPASDVTLGISSSNTKEGTVSPSKLTFTAANWRAPQHVTVSGVDDDIVDGNQPYTVVMSAADSADTAYKGIDPPDVDLINIDNESAGILVTPQGDLVTSEPGLAASFTVSLAAAPAEDVAIDFASTAPVKSLLNPRRITFTSRNWSAPQVITVNGTDDPNSTTIDGNIAYQVIGKIDVPNSDPAYGILPDVELDFVSLDKETPGLLITPLRGLSTTEAGGKATFAIALQSKPLGDVHIDLTSSNIAEGTVFPASLTFTSVNYNAPQTVTVTGVDDAIRDGDQPYAIVTMPAVSTDDAYKGLDGPDVVLVNRDDDTPGVVVIQSGPLVTSESGGAATFALRLAAAPNNDVSVNLSSTNAAEGEVVPGIVTFTPVNWSSPQTVTVVGKDDQLADGPQEYRVVIAPTGSSEMAYQGLDTDDIIVTNLDDETPQIIVLADTPLITTETGGTATFSVALGSPPMSQVTLFLSTSRPAEGSVSPPQLVFTSSNWKSRQLVTVAGVDDAAPDGNQPYTVVIARGSSADPGYNGIKPPEVPALNLDDDSAGVNVIAANGLATGEDGTRASFSVVLDAKPMSDVSIALRSTLPTEGTPTPEKLTFTAANWNAPQTVVVTGVDDAVVDGARAYQIVLDPPTGDPAYASIDPRDVDLVNLDNDSPAIQVIQPKIATTSESGGAVTFGVVLTSQPGGDVAIPLINSNTAEGALSTGMLTFTAVNWGTPQWITVTGLDDTIVDGDLPYKISVGPATGQNSGYQGRRGSDVPLVNLDNDAAGFFVSAPQGPTTEGGISTNFTVSLITKPITAVTVPIASTRPTEGVPLTTALTFTPLNWNAPQSVTIRGIDDKLVDGDQIYRVQVGPSASIGDANTPGGDPNYKGKKAPDIILTNLDDESAGIRVTAAADLRTTEAGGTAIFKVVLACAPTDNVSIPLVSRVPSEGAITDPSPATLLFTPANWSIAQTVTVTGVDDSVPDGNMPYAIRFQSATSADGRYVGRVADDVPFINIDDDSAGVTVLASSSLTTTESGGSTTFRLVLNKAPGAGVSIAMHSSNTAEGTVSPASVQFSTDDWNAPQTVTITGQQDMIADGNQLYYVVFDPVQSSDKAYGDMRIDPLTVTNLDDDSAPPLATPAKPRRPIGHSRRTAPTDAISPK